MRWLGPVLALVPMLALWPSPTLAQAYQCTPPGRIEPFAVPSPNGAPRRVAVAGYTLAASWSPDYCKTSGDTASMQCSGRNGRFGFVLHGLWPEARRGPSPQWCSAMPQPSMQDLRAHLCMTPSARLLAHEWAKHGSCMAKSPAQYFRVAAVLWRSIRWPDADRLSRQDDLTAGDLRRAFVRLNPSWKVEQVGVQLSRTGWLREVQLCYSRRFLPVKCDRRHLGASDTTPLKIWRGL
ncbi:ribonuclease T2 [Novosphingobium chloroacetimidivorans]|uniref:Ribonuclease T2 n=1 Tax=Novosphingobium chloroacetimidivorans TaxID=1428314 RepID=A0A7W7K867_9SPHN|nr:ribonuclease T [Novosphingobium chloroacetimidivorans]MBB4857996.1 ribonuclease T2 [Novosphingobium chloroacetimidivorans]